MNNMQNFKTIAVDFDGSLLFNVCSFRNTRFLCNCICFFQTVGDFQNLFSISSDKFLLSTGTKNGKFLCVYFRLYSMVHS